MSEEHKKSIAAALHRHHAKLAKDQEPKPIRHNEKPEKEVEKSCLKWMRDLGWSVQIIESKATYNPKAGVWLQQGAKQGTVDCIGNTAEGIAVAVEFKAPGRLSTLRYNQRQFLTDKINTGVFACVTDSVERLATIYSRWKMLRGQSLGEAREYLISMLPEMKDKKDDSLFDD